MTNELPKEVGTPIVLCFVEERKAKEKRAKPGDALQGPRTYVTGDSESELFRTSVSFRRNRTGIDETTKPKLIPVIFWFPFTLHDLCVTSRRVWLPCGSFRASSFASRKRSRLLSIEFLRISAQNVRTFVTFSSRSFDEFHRFHESKFSREKCPRASSNTGLRSFADVSRFSLRAAEERIPKHAHQSTTSSVNNDASLADRS